MGRRGGSTHFLGTDRFDVVRVVGSGGMGTVYEVQDRHRGRRVALKTVGIADGHSLLRFKREFRELRDLRHPNLVELGELIEMGGEWFYTMELVEGVDFASHVSAEPSLRGHPTGSSTEPMLPPVGDEARALELERAAPERRHGGFHEGRLRAALGQLATGLVFLHAARKVHRDLKPGNVLVDQSGRVVILDFGLVTDVSSGFQKTDVGAIGTLRYMAPEQASGRPVDGRADWYSVGVMLFEALTGRPPFEVRSLAALAKKVVEEAPDPKSIAPGIPDDLASLCRELLRIDPDARPSLRRIREVLSLDDEPAGHGGLPSRSRSGAESEFVGRERERAILHEEFDHIRACDARAVLLRGEVGIGKTHLVKRFLSETRGTTPGLLELHGRCAQYESVPFKGLDGVVDALCSHLAKLPADAVKELMPAEIDTLARTFPVLRRVVKRPAPSTRDIRDPQEQRAEVFSALRALLRRVAATQPTVLILEDAQFLDEDSATLLGEIVRKPAAPTFLLVIVERVDDAHGADTRALAIARATGARVVELPRLSQEEATSLAEAQLERADVTLTPWAGAIGRESRGHPLFVDELTQYVEIEGGRVEGDLTLAAAIGRRIELAGARPLEVLRVVAVAGGPIARRTLFGALAEPATLVDRNLAVLETLRLVRSEGTMPTSRVEPYHGMVASTVLASVDEDHPASLHGNVARALEGFSDADPVELGRHWAGAGERRRAAECYALAAENAQRALAFDRAAELMARSLELEPADGPGLEGRLLRRGHALASAGRGFDAGTVFAEAAKSARGVAALDLRRLSAEQFMLSGHHARGVQAFKDVLAELDIDMPKSRIGFLLSLAVSALVLFVRGRAFRERDAASVDPVERIAVDVCRSLSLGLMHTDTIMGFDFQLRALRRALRLGEPERVAILLATESGQLASGGRRAYRRSLARREQARAAAARAGTSYARGMYVWSDGMGHYLAGEWRPALEVFERAERIFRSECPTTPSELRLIQASVVQCLWEAGEWRALNERLSRAVKEATERGDLFTEATIRAGFAQRIGCVTDDAPLRISEAARTMDAWTGERFDVQRWLYCVMGSFAADYVHPGGEGFATIDAVLRPARRSMLFTVQLMRAGFYREHGLRAVQRALAHPGERPRLIRIALADARRLAREDSPWAVAGGHLIRGCAYAVTESRTRSATELQRAIEEFEAAGMRGYASAARWAKGSVLGPDEGAELIDLARAYMVSEGVARPERFAMALAPVKLVP